MKSYLQLLPVLCVLLSSCSKNQYSAHEVTIKAEGYTDDGIELRFITPSESSYYCPGLELDYDRDKVRFSYVRSHIDKVSSVDAKAEFRDGESVVIIPFPPERKRVELIDSSGTSLGSWERGHLQGLNQSRLRNEPSQP